LLQARFQSHNVDDFRRLLRLQGGSNDEHCLITRALAVVAPDLAKMLVMKPAAKANILSTVGWRPSGCIDWSTDALPPLPADELASCVMPP